MTYISRLSSLAASLLIFGAASTTVIAADINTEVGTQAIEPVLDPVQNSSIWNGVYGGLYGGLKWQSVGVMGSDDIDLNKKKDIGGYVGINQALGSSIIGGLEWMGGFSGQSETNDGIKAEQDWETSLRARMGYAFERNLVYGLAGVSASRVELSEGGESDQNWLTGYTVGAGLERMFTDRVSGRLEYDYSKYGEKEFNLGSGSTDADLSGHGVKAGIGLKF